jgi:CheY-like chemotaxis protein
LSGHKVYEAQDGPSGVNAAVAVRPHVALIDVGLPGFDGYEVAKRIRSVMPAHEVALIALTGYGQREHRQRARAAGFRAYLVKPVRPGQLAQEIARLPPLESPATQR